MFLYPNNRNDKKGLSLIELIVVISIIAVMSGFIAVMVSSFSHSRNLETSATKLLGDLRQTQQFARAQRNGYKYYGILFLGSLGENNDCDGWKIVRYNPPGGTQPIDMVPPVDFGEITIIKSSEAGDNPEFIEDTFFKKSVVIDAASDFQVNDSIVFTPEGSATSDGENLLTDNNGDGFLGIVLTLNGNSKTIPISPLTGHVKIID